MAYEMRDVIVLVPGIGGSALQRDGRDVWNMSAGAVARALRTLGRSIGTLALAEDPWEEDDLGDGVTAPRLLPDLHLVPGLWKIDGYAKIARAVESAFDVKRGENLFELPYDWRRDCRVAARRLARSSHDWLAAWRERSGNPDARLVIVGHSMGGLVARWFLEAMDGWKDTRVLVTFGTPYGGSVNAVDFLANGFRKGVGPLTVDLSAMLRSFTSVYQLLPVFRCVETGTGLVRVADAALPNLDAARVAAAADFHEQIRAAVEAHQDDDAYRSGGYAIRPVVGEGQPTLQSARLAGGKVEVLRHRDGKDDGGDGTVPKLSSFPRELLEDQRNVMFASERHASLQNADPVLVQLTGILRGLTADAADYYAVNARLGLDVEDVYTADEPIVLRARSDPGGVALTAAVTDAAKGAPMPTADFTGTDEEDGWQRAELAPLAPGDYRVTVSGEFAVAPVTDVFTVLET